MNGWENLLIAEVGASAALLGLVFVGVSINLTKIISLPGLPNRAFLALIILLTILIICSLLLVPGQSLTLVGSRDYNFVYQSPSGCVGFTGRDQPLGILEGYSDSSVSYAFLLFLIQHSHKLNYSSTSIPLEYVQDRMVSSPKKYRLF